MNRSSPSSLTTVFLIAIMASARGAEDLAPVVHKDDEAVSALAPDQIAEPPITDSDRDHWAFRPLTRPEMPAVAGRLWPQNGIDSFILSRQERKKTNPSADADRATLIRRLSFALTGLPPTMVELQEFEADTHPDAYERLVDRLLASSAYGERWAQHWLDLARFAETDGFEHDLVRKDAWKYRDWVIGVLNSDLPFDKFVALQIAGDQLPESDGDVATMFCLSGPDMPDINDQLERRHRMLNEITSTVGSVFLGLQMGCAECHDHKYDPLSQKEFYELRAVFESAVAPLKRDVPFPRLEQQATVEPARFWIRGDHKRPGPRVEPAFPRIASDGRDRVAPSQGTSLRMALANWLVRSQNPLTSRVIVNRIWKLHFERGLFDTPSDVGMLNAEPTHPELLDWLATGLQGHSWSLKWLHREIVCSHVYRQASGSVSADSDWARRLQIDPDGQLYSRRLRRRLDGESLRDAMLAMAGLLSDERGGPGIMAPLPDELVGTLLKGQWTISPRAADHDRRSIYLFARRNLRYPMFEAFDRPDANASCAVRNRSTTAPQSLLLINSQFSLQVARSLAGEILRQTDDSAQQVEQLILRIYSRRPTSTESRKIVEFVVRERKKLVDSQCPVEQLALPPGVDVTKDPYAAAAFTQACLAVLNTNEMLYVD